MQTKQLQKLVLNALADYKVLDVVNLDVRDLTDVADQMIIGTATSKRHAQSAADHLASTSKAAGVKPIGVEGVQEGEWILIDLGDILVHIMLQTTRDFYSLEKLWTSAKTLRKSKKDHG
jgi:ribosome-associated protein